ncbi:glycosyltransferase family 2 protein [Lysobacter sp. LF1]|uniref:Glycosyltransferase family 2 protein n=1 Tax=Lysobacter stagni TaxID=3045172 RepID=A0ABT6XFA1_9GAMM|nr:glycosyltransferase family 2 protein [Lysobacter sp. LF1]MDI9238741.1 glycosyltransferase family 2 protein [Lysobacter sp. LF1]
MARCVDWNSGIAVVIPSYKVVKHIEAVIASIGPEVDVIYCVDDACPAGSGDFIEREIKDLRVRVLRNSTNLGVGGAVMTGYRQAVVDGARVIVKIDGDGQMDPALLPGFVAPILAGEADYTKGNRFWDLSEITRMPALRRIGNLGLSFMAKASTGYWDVFDPTNGYTAIHASVAERLPYDSISRRYFFETDILFRLNTMRAVVVDIPMDAKYGDEVSGLKISNIVFEFAFKHMRNFGKRIAYNYFLRDLSIASLELIAAAVLLSFGLAFGAWSWFQSFSTDVPASTGTIMISVLSMLVGIQFLLAFLGYDIANMPRRALHTRLSTRLRPRHKESA